MLGSDGGDPAAALAKGAPPEFMFRIDNTKQLM
jgi:hypothetical protein